MFELTGAWSLLVQIPIGLLGLSWLVFIHELGHFAVAKWVGTRVHTFSIGFGKKIFRWRKGETEYCVSMIPFGGYVAMSGDIPLDAESKEKNTDERDFSNKSIPARGAIALAGPVVNIAFSFFVLVLLYMVGVQEEQYDMLVGDVAQGSAGEIAGVKKGDKLLSLNGKTVQNFESFIQEVAIVGETSVPLIVLRDGAEKSLTLTPQMNPKWGIAMAGISLSGEIYVHGLTPGKPAEQAGLKVNDVIISVDGARIGSVNMLIERVNSSKGNPVRLVVDRDGKNQVIEVTPFFDEELGRYIVGLYPHHKVPEVFVQRGFSESIAKSWNKNLEFATVMFRTIGGISQGNIKPKALSGPIGIMQIIANSLNISLQRFIEILALISLNLGLINLLPLAITDGGILMFLLLEAIRGKPLKMSTQVVINKIAVSVFIFIALFVTFHDILRVPTFLN